MSESDRVVVVTGIGGMGLAIARTARARIDAVAGRCQILQPRGGGRGSSSRGSHGG